MSIEFVFGLEGAGEEHRDIRLLNVWQLIHGYYGDKTQACTPRKT